MRGDPLEPWQSVLFAFRSFYAGDSRIAKMKSANRDAHESRSWSSRHADSLLRVAAALNEVARLDELLPRVAAEVAQAVGVNCATATHTTQCRPEPLQADTSVRRTLMR